MIRTLTTYNKLYVYVICHTKGQPYQENDKLRLLLLPLYEMSIVAFWISNVHTCLLLLIS